MVHVSNMGGLFRLTRKQYTDFLSRRANGAEVWQALEACGAKDLGTVEDVTDMSAEDASRLLPLRFSAKGGR